MEWNVPILVRLAQEVVRLGSLLACLVQNFLQRMVDWGVLVITATEEQEIGSWTH